MWLLSIDTGGTFTDCVARDPAGRRRRAKVLSTSALRGRIVEVDHAGRGRVEASWLTSGVVAADGRWTFRQLGGADPRRPLRAIDPASGWMELETPLDPDAAGSAFEVRSPEPAPVLAARLVTGTPAGVDLPPADVRLATTQGTNTLLERRGAPTALFVTAGFRDLLVIGDQQRPDLFALRIVKPTPLTAAVVEVPERLAADGVVLEPLDPAGVDAGARAALAAGIRSAAIALLHAYRRPDHERQLATHLRRLGFIDVACSSELAPLIGLLPRAETAVVEAALGPVVGAYLRTVRGALPAGRLHVMTSAGGLVRVEDFAAKDSLLSGPAGGVAGAAAAGRRAGFMRVIGFDMGGTSTDVCRWDGVFEYRFEHRVAGTRLLSPALAIETVAAGGGSVCHAHHGRPRVGPRSAGAEPGPACYGAGGPLTLTDVNLLLGRLDAGDFAIPVDVSHAERAAAALRAAVTVPGTDPPDLETLLDGLRDLADERMAGAIAEVSTRCGYDPGDYTLVAFGGAGGQHACAVADRLGIRTVLMPVDASLLSAAGLETAAIERFAQRQVLRRLDEIAADLPHWLDALGAEATAAVRQDAGHAAAVQRRIAQVRLEGQETTIDLEVEDPATLAASFRRAYRQRYGHDPPAKAIEVESVRVVAAALPSADAVEVTDAFAPVGTPELGSGSPGASRRAWFAGRWREVPVCDRATLPRGAVVAGPALVPGHRSTLVVEPGWRATVNEHGDLVARRVVTASPTALDRGAPTAVVRELYTYRFMSIARAMGEQLRRTAVSTNIKERLDFSCAILDADGTLIVNAPHIPVHLGALGPCVRAVRERLAIAPGDVVVTNHPACGGSHLPDVTVIAPVDVDGTRVGYVAARAHHAEIGGARPGSMPPDATVLAEEGVALEPMYLVRAGHAQFDEVERRLRAGPWPSRAVDDNLADLRAQVAACHRGAQMLATLAGPAGVDVVVEHLHAVTAHVERLTRAMITRMPAGSRTAEERLDDGHVLRVALRADGDGLAVDWTGSGPRHPGNLNATPAIVQAAVMYVLRLLMGDAGRGVPLNEGLVRPVTIRLTPGLLDPAFTDDPSTSPAVVGGNVETSQRLVDTMLKTLGVCAASQGTMNNVLFGAADFAYYETVGGGSGAGADFDGADGVQTHMTNTRITDPETLEHRFPVRLEAFAVRRGSGGRGRHRGGDGLLRRYLFLAPMAVSVLGQRRRSGPYGLAGGAPGRPGRQRLHRADGSVVTLPAIGGCDVGPGDRLVLETPGGGGCGAASEAGNSPRNGGKRGPCDSVREGVEL